ncbi:Mu-like prophage I protein [Marinobacter subterrani]|uniref:Mu-like prophage I protein n=1 Tax=Marinobacter subterrani TaxID=1658765 RepID=A0A0J7M7Y6_9GAMM|nr:Mu-like prophage I protein [Marinobacter subterrani]
MRQALELGDDEKPAEAWPRSRARPQSAEPDLTQYVPRAVYNEVNQQLAALKQGGDQQELNNLVEEGLKDGRIAARRTPNG